MHYAFEKYKLCEALAGFPIQHSLFTRAYSRNINMRWLLVWIHVPYILEKAYTKVNEYIRRNRCRMHGCKMLLMNAATIWKIYKLCEALLGFPVRHSLVTCACPQVISLRWLLVWIHVPQNLQNAYVKVGHFICMNRCIMGE